MVARLNPKLAVALIIVLVAVLTTNEDAVSAFIASSNHRRAPKPALVVVRDPTVPSIDWDIFEMEEQVAFDSAVIRRPTMPSGDDIETMNIPAVSISQNSKQESIPLIEVPVDDMDAWKGSLLMVSGLLVSHHDIPALMLLLSTAASGEFGTGVRLVSRCLWNAVDVCKVLSTEGFQSISELLKDVGVVEEAKKENWIVSWAKRSWNKAVAQERQWANALQRSFVPDHVEEEKDSDSKQEAPQETPFPIGATVPVSSARAVVEQATEEGPQGFAAVLQREEGVLNLPLKPTIVPNKQQGGDLMSQAKQFTQELQHELKEEESATKGIELNVKEPKIEASGRQKVRDLMRQRQQQSAETEMEPSLQLSTGASATEALHPSTVASKAADSRQRVRDLMRQRQRGTAAATPTLFQSEHLTTTAALHAQKTSGAAGKVRDLMRQRGTEVATPALFQSEHLTTTAALHAQKTSGAADSRQRVRDLMRQGRNQQLVTEAKPEPQALSARAAIMTPKEKAAHSRQRVRDLLRQKREQDARDERMAVASQLKERIAACQAPKESLDDSFRTQRLLNSSVRNKIRGIKMNKGMVENGMLTTPGSVHFEVEGSTPREPKTASGWSPLTMTEKKSLREARAAHVARPSVGAGSTVAQPKKQWRKRIARWLRGASPQGWVDSSPKQFALD